MYHHCINISHDRIPTTTQVRRGDVEIVKILLDNGADPYVENSLGMNAFHICNEFGPYPRVMDLLSKY